MAMPGLIPAAAGSAAAFLAADFAVGAVRASGANPLIDADGAAGAILSAASSGQFVSTDPMALAIALAAACAVWVAWARWTISQGEYRDGEEHGSSRWASRKEAQAFMDKKDPDNNIILTQNCALRFVDDVHDELTERNNNVCVIGAPGTGKTRYYVLPNLMQMNANVFLTDPKSQTIYDMGPVYEEAGWEIKHFSTIDFSRSLHFNPFAYIFDDTDILRFVECLIDNTTGDQEHAGDPFWPNTERLLYTALTAYLVYHCPPEDRNVGGLLTLLSLADAREGDPDWKSPLDMLFDELETGMRLRRAPGAAAEFDPESRGFDAGAAGCVWQRVCEPLEPCQDLALSSYRECRVAADKTLKSIIISCNVRMKPFAVSGVRELLSFDEMELGSLGDAGRKVAVFASMSDTDHTFDFVFALLMWQAMNALCRAADATPYGRLARPVHFLFDEFANIGKLPDFEHSISVMRSRNISVSLILQSIAQLSEAYGENNAQTIVDCCDTTVFLGGKSTKTNREISEQLGKQTVQTVSVNDSRGASSSTTRNFNRIERDLMQASEVGRLPRDEALVLIGGALPVRDRKYRLESHRRYGMLKAARGAGFDYAAYLERRRRAMR